MNETEVLMNPMKWLEFGQAGLLACALVVSNWRLLVHFDRAQSAMRADHTAEAERLVTMIGLRLGDHARAVEAIADELIELRRELRHDRRS